METRSWRNLHRCLLESLRNSWMIWLWAPLSLGAVQQIFGTRLGPGLWLGVLQWVSWCACCHELSSIWLVEIRGYGPRMVAFVGPSILPPFLTGPAILTMYCGSYDISGLQGILLKLLCKGLRCGFQAAGNHNCLQEVPLLMIQILHDFRYQHPRNSGSIL